MATHLIPKYGDEFIIQTFKAASKLVEPFFKYYFSTELISGNVHFDEERGVFQAKEGQVIPFSANTFFIDEAHIVISEGSPSLIISLERGIIDIIDGEEHVIPSFKFDHLEVRGSIVGLDEERMRHFGKVLGFLHERLIAMPETVKEDQVDESANGACSSTHISILRSLEGVHASIIEKLSNQAILLQDEYHRKEEVLEKEFNQKRESLKEEIQKNFKPHKRALRRS